MNSLLHEAQLMLDRAEDTLEDAETILKMNMVLAAVNRTYYGVFYCISALLITEDVVSKTHQGAQIKFNELFIKTDKLPRKLSDWAKKAEGLRQSADYDITYEINNEEVNEALRNALEFYNLAKIFIRQLIADSSQP